MTAIRLENVSKQYMLRRQSSLYLRDTITGFLNRRRPFGAPTAPPEKEFFALKDVSFEIKRGEAVGIIGRNGAGKSTILKLLAGVTKPSSGSAMTCGRIAPLIEIGAGFHPELSGEENIYLNGSIIGMRKAEIDARFDDIVRFAELEAFIDTPVKHYSSGMYMRLGFAIAVHTNPDIYLIDEVLAVGDAAFQQKCLETLAGHKAEGKTLILVSHNLKQIEQVCDRCIYLAEGDVRYDGTPALAIRQYMSDIRQRRSGKEVRTDSLGLSAQIVSVRFLDGGGRERPIFETGEDVLIEIRYRMYEWVENPVFAIGIHGPEGEYVSECSSRAARIPMIGLDGEGAMVCRVRDLPLWDGTYLVTVSLTSRPDKKFLDHHWQRYQFRVKGHEPERDGLVRLHTEWWHAPGVELREEAAETSS